MEFPVDTFLKRRIRGLGGGGGSKVEVFEGCRRDSFKRLPGFLYRLLNDMSLGFGVWDVLGFSL